MLCYVFARLSTLPLLGILPTVVSSAKVTDGIEWWNPAFGILQLYDVDEDLSSEVVHSVAPAIRKTGSTPFRGLTHALPPRKKIPMERLILLGEDSVDTRIIGNEGAQASAIVDGAGSGKGAGKGANKGTITFAGSDAAAANAIFHKENGQRTASNGTVNAIVNATATGKQPLATRSWFSFLRFSFSFAFVVKTLCMMCNICYQASPLPLINEFNAKGDTGDADLAPFIATAYGGWQWCFYGLFAYIVTQKSGFLVLVYSNVVGATLGLYYVYAFHLHCRNVSMLQKSYKYYLALSFLVLIQFIAIMVSQPVHALFFSGLISSVWSTIGSLALIATVPKVYETKNSKSLPVPLLVVGEIASCLWIVCGVVLWDPWITFPNVFALIVCTFALYLCWKFPSTGCDTDDDEVHVPSTDPFENGDIVASPHQRASPLQRAMDFVSLSSNREAQSLQNHPATYGRYGATSYKRPGTGGTGDSF